MCIVNYSTEQLVTQSLIMSHTLSLVMNNVQQTKWRINSKTMHAQFQDLVSVTNDSNIKTEYVTSCQAYQYTYCQGLGMTRLVRSKNI